MRDALRRTLAQLAREVAQGLDPRAENAAPASHPRTVEGVRVTIRHLQETLQRLDDVQDFPTIGDIDDDMYRLWKELEKKMQMHRQSEAKFQLKDMFRI